MAAGDVTFDRFSGRMQEALAWAAAIEPGVVGTRSLLLGMIRADPDGEPAQLLRGLDIAPARLEETVTEVRPTVGLALDAGAPARIDELPELSSNAEIALDRAFRQVDRTEIDLGDALLALLALPDSTAFHALQRLVEPGRPMGWLYEVCAEYTALPDSRSLSTRLRESWPREARVSFKGDAPSVKAIAVGPRGQVAIGYDGGVQVWSPPAGGLVDTPLLAGRALRMVAFSGDGAWLVCLADAGGAVLRLSAEAEPATVHASDAPAGSVFEFDQTLAEVVFAADSRTLIGRALNGTVMSFSVPDGEARSVARRGIEALALAADGVHAIVAWKDGLGVWSITDDSVRPFAKFSPGSDRGPLVCSRDGSRIAVADADGVVIVAASDAEPVRVGGGPPTALALSPDGSVLVGGDRGSVWAVDALRADERRYLRRPESAVVALAFAPDGKQVASASSASAMLQRLPAAAGLRDGPAWQSDAPSRADRLERKPLARALATRMERMAEDASTSYLIHVDGPWGSGKSTVVGFLGEQLREKGWLVVDFDAWRQSRVGPPWWALLTSLRHTLRHDLGRRRGWGLRLVELAARLKRGWQSYLSALVVLAVAFGAFALLDPAGDVGELARIFSAAVAALATVWLGGKVLARFLMWESATGAKLFEQSQQDPMEALAQHFAWLVKRSRKRVVFFVDDLDRCSEDYVVDLLDSIQTLVRDASARAGAGAGDPFFVVAADGRWIRRSYEATYHTFEETVGEPGRPLGYLFLDKIFQLTVRVPAIGLEQRKSFLSSLLPERASSAPESDASALRDRIASSSTPEQVLAVLGEARADEHAELAATAIERLNDSDLERQTEHRLERFAALLESNPRSMKRFVNAYSMALSIALLEGRAVEPDPLAIWTIVTMRWPDLADALAADPERLDALGSREWGGPEALRPLATSQRIRDVVGFDRLLTKDALVELSST